jgi:hypothetical protein
MEIELLLLREVGQAASLRGGWIPPQWADWQSAAA